ncbi:MAG: diacylglycerol kinase family lipid kinase [Crocinitomicaceae bacterium]|nr:diacylglycerol kinase family lipid kinase [Crocinitomicaceae bacterium]
MKKTVTLIVHGHRKLADKTLETIELMNGEPTLIIKKKLTKGPGDASEIAQTASTKSDVVIAVGGDGTCNEVVNGLMITPNPEIIFGVIPNGTGNDFVRNFPPFDPYAFVTSIVEGSAKSIDLGKIDFGQPSRYFLNVADIGFGASVVETMNRQRKSGIGGKLSYNLAILRTFFSYRKPVLRVHNNEFEFEGKSLMVVFSNGTTFGHGLQIYPEAQLDSAKLGLAVIGNVSLFEYAKNLGNLKEGRKIDHPEVKYHEFEKIHVSTTNKNLCVETDGEIAGRSSITVEVLPKALRIIIA